MTRIFFTLLISCFAATVFAQFNDDCSTATPVPDVSNFCSSVNAGDNQLATPSNVPAPSCGIGLSGSDVWYSFTATATDVVIIINGATVFTPGGTLQQPAVTLYSGSCNNLMEIDCAAATNFQNIIELRTGGLTPGQTYYFRVDGLIPGTFQYCIRNYFLSDAIAGDCPDAVVLCDKSPFNVGAVTGFGSDPTEINDAPCFLGVNGELNSTWFVWTAANNGTLEFTLTPNNLSDDLDFVIYQLPNGIGNCAGKFVERCMAAGDFIIPSPCMGPTGLNSLATDISQDAGCTSTGGPLDNFLAPLNMTAGTSYALVINNFTSSGNGFQVEWGGTGEFLGPQAGFTADPSDSTICIGDPILFIDSSSFANGSLVAWHWNFGEGATPAFADTLHPPAVRYTLGGEKLVTLTVQADLGCIVTVTRPLQVDTCCNLMVSVDVVAEVGGGTATAQVSNGFPPYVIQWDGVQGDTVVTGLAVGDHSVSVTDVYGCSDTLSFTVPPPEKLEFPNAFTPDGDETNDHLFPVIMGDITILEFEVWSRWGQRVWEGTTGGWDGKLDGNAAPSDVYVYRGRARFPDGHEVAFQKEAVLLR